MVINYNGSKGKSRRSAAGILQAGGQAHIYQCNVADFQACGEMSKDTISKMGHLDILVNNAGITKDGLLMGMRRRRFFQGSGYQSKRNILLYPSCCQNHDQTEKRQDHQFKLHCRCYFQEMQDRQIMLHLRQG